ncbi:MAG: ABC transporter permease [Clostridiales bacterium]|nr:ABC transporter permease [Clostridiales bacterium]
MDNKPAANLDHLNLDHLFVLRPYEKDVTEIIEYSNYSYWGSTIRTFLKSKVGVAGLIIAVFVTLFAILEQFFPNAAGEIAIGNGYRPYEWIHYLADMSKWKMPPTALHWFGTDSVGRDCWARVWYGARISMLLAIEVSVFEISIGFILGAVWGYVRWLDKFMLELYNAVMNIPRMIIYVLVMYIMQPSFLTIFVSMSLVGWLGMAKYTRNLVFIIRDREYNLASRVLGTPITRIVTKNILPHLLSVVMLYLSQLIVSVIGAEVTLTFLGVGLPPEIPSLGVLISEGRTQINYRPHLLIFPTLVVALITISFYVFGNALSDASDPKNHT